MLPKETIFTNLGEKNCRRCTKEGDLYDVFNLNLARRALEEQSHQELVIECTANKRLQEKFDAIALMMGQMQGTIQNNDPQ